MNPTMGTHDAAGPVVESINKHMLAQGGTPVRTKMENGLAQLWVQDATGRVIAARDAKALARVLGVKGADPNERWVPTKRAASMSGYEKSTVLRCARAGMIEHEKRGNKEYFNVGSLMKWAEQRKLGARTKPHRSGKRKPSAGVAVEASAGKYKYKIERGIPVGQDKRTVSAYPFAMMKVGDSFLVSVAPSARPATQRSVSAASVTFAKRTKTSFTTRIVSNGVRCWRIK